MEDKIMVDTSVLVSRIDHLLRECNIRDPQRKNGYLTALLDVKEEIWKIEQEERYMPF